MHALHQHHLQFVALSLVVAVLGSWTALDLFRRVRFHIGQTRRIWLGAAAVAMGLSIWSMHFIAMLGFDPGSPVSYDPGLTLLSLALAMGATGGAFAAAAKEIPSRQRLLVAGSAMGVGICLMHYVGMAALRTAVSLGYAPLYVVVSFLIAILASAAALIFAIKERSMGSRAAAALILGLAIAGMHYTAMAGLQITIVEGAAPQPGAPPVVLGAGVAGGTLLLLLIALLASLYDQRLNVLAALDAGRVGYWEISIPRRTLQLSPKGKEILGREANEPFGYDDLMNLLDPADRLRRDGLVEKAVSEGGLYDAEYGLNNPDRPGQWVNVRGRVLGGADGRPQSVIGILLDVTDRHAAFAAVAEAERRQRLLIDELNHRVKNTLATVQSIARQTAKGASSIDSFREDFDARLQALSHTHNALTRGGWEGARLMELLSQELSPYGADHYTLIGEDLVLPARHALAVGMVLHELATNAAKYGALASGGQVSVEWSVGEGPILSMDWAERGAANVGPPSREGFGSRLLKASIERELSGQVVREFQPGGMICRLSVPLT